MPFVILILVCVLSTSCGGQQGNSAPGSANLPQASSAVDFPSPEDTLRAFSEAGNKRDLQQMSHYVTKGSHALLDKVGAEMTSHMNRMVPAGPVQIVSSDSNRPWVMARIGSAGDTHDAFLRQEDGSWRVDFEEELAFFADMMLGAKGGKQAEVPMSERLSAVQLVGGEYSPAWRVATEFKHRSEVLPTSVLDKAEHNFWTEDGSRVIVEYVLYRTDEDAGWAMWKEMARNNDRAGFSTLDLGDESFYVSRTEGDGTSIASSIAFRAGAWLVRIANVSEEAGAACARHILTRLK